MDFRCRKKYGHDASRRFVFRGPRTPLTDSCKPPVADDDNIHPKDRSGDRADKYTNTAILGRRVLVGLLNNSVPETRLMLLDRKGYETFHTHIMAAYDAAASITHTDLLPQSILGKCFRRLMLWIRTPVGEPPAESARQFHLFRFLPPELRFTIWEMALEDTRRRLQLTKPSNMGRWDTVASPPSVFYACTEGRRVAQRQLCRRGGVPRPHPRIVEYSYWLMAADYVDAGVGSVRQSAKFLRPVVPHLAAVAIDVEVFLNRPTFPTLLKDRKIDPLIAGGRTILVVAQTIHILLPPDPSGASVDKGLLERPQYRPYTHTVSDVVRLDDVARIRDYLTLADASEGWRHRCRGGVRVQLCEMPVCLDCVLLRWHKTLLPECMRCVMRSRQLDQKDQEWREYVSAMKQKFVPAVRFTVVWPGMRLAHNSYETRI